MKEKNTFNKLGIHTFMLNYINLNHNEYNRLFELFKRSICDRTDNYDYVKTDILKKSGYEGIFPKLYNKNGHFHMSVVVTPQSLIENRYCELEIWQNSSKESIDKLSVLIDEALSIISDTKNIYTFENGLISRVDLCVNIHFESSYIVRQYIKLADKSVKNERDEKYDYFHTEKGALDKGANKHSFSINCENYGLTIYDKKYELAKNGAIDYPNAEFGDVLRIEVKIKRGYINKLSSNMYSNADRLIYLLENERCIMLCALNYFFFPGDYYTFRKAEQLIRKKGYKQKTIYRMIDIVADKGNIQKVYDKIMRAEHLSEKAIQRLKNKFAECELNPTKISRKDAIWVGSFLPGFFKLIESAD